MAVALSEAARRRVVELAADRLASMAPEEVPAGLRRFARFAPARRAQLAAVPLASALENDPEFRQQVAETVRAAFPDVVEALDRAMPLPAADPADVAALAYLIRSDGWEAVVEHAVDHERAERAARAVETSRRDSERQSRREAASRRAAADELDQLRRRLDRSAAETERERSRARNATERAAGLEAELTAARTELAAESAARADLSAEYDRERKRLLDRLAAAEAAAARLRRESKDDRDAADARRWILLDMLARGVKGLREELALTPPRQLPADGIAAAGPEAAVPALAGDSPQDLDLLLALPQAHLVVDGYNVTKTGYPELALADQRNRLVVGLAALAARTGAEVTCVFDGTDVEVRVPSAAQRQVRVRFSPAGQTADELIRRLVRAEPAGRPVTVCSADGEVIDGVRRAGARTITPRALLSRLDRA